MSNGVFNFCADAVYWLNELEGPGVIWLSVLTVCVTVMCWLIVWGRKR